MLTVPNMILIGGNSRNCGKTSMACQLISALSATHQIIGLKITSIRPGEAGMHGHHRAGNFDDFIILEEHDAGSPKDTSSMLRAGASKVFYIQAPEHLFEKSLLHFLSMYINKQIIVCESRSLRRVVTPGLFLLMMRLPDERRPKNDLAFFLQLADKVFYFDENQEYKNQYAKNLRFVDGKFG